MPNDPETARWYVEHLAPHQTELRYWLQGKFPAIDDIESIVQDANLRVLRERAKGVPIDNPKGLLFHAARNLACNHYNKYHLRVTDPIGFPHEMPVLDAAIDIPETIARNEELELMTQAIQSLPDRCRQVITLRTVYELSYKEIAAELNMALKTVEAHMAKGVDRCIEYIAKHRDS
jgi:RNA polymerase sigma factor (sigma-70 family)